MPLVSEESLYSGNLAPIYEIQSDPEESGNEPAWSQTFASAAKLENPVISWISQEGGLPSSAEGIDDNFDPFTEIEGYEFFADRFSFANNSDEVGAIKRQIDDEQEDREILASSGTLGTVAALAMGITDPINLIPVGGTAYKSYKTGGRILEGAVQTAKVGLYSAVASEAALQATQETRSLGESTLNVAGSVILSGALGAGAGLLSSKVTGKGYEDLAQAIEDDLNADILPNEWGAAEINADDFFGRSAGAAAALDPEDITLAPSFKTTALGKAPVVAGVDLFNSPDLRILNSKSVAARKHGLDLFETPLMIKGAEGGKYTPKIPVSRLIEMHKAPLAQAHMNLDKQFMSYRGVEGFVKGKIAKVKSDGDKLTWSEFKVQVAHALRNGDTHDIPQVEAATKQYRRDVFEPLKEKAIKHDLLPEGVKVETADSYLMRVWDKQKIKKNRTPLKRTIADYIRPKNPELGDLEIDELADQIIDRIIGTPDGRLPYDVTVPTGRSGGQGKRGALNERVFDIPDNMVSDFLVNDVEQIANLYNGTMAPDIEMTARFGDTRMTSALDDIRSDYAGKIEKAKDPKTKEALEKARDKDIADMAAMRDRLLRVYKSGPEHTTARENIGVLKSFNVLRLMGGILPSSISDLGRLAMVDGYSPVFTGTIKKFATSPEFRKLSKQEAQLMGTATDLVLEGRAQILTDIADDFGRNSGFNTKLRNATTNFLHATGITKWNETLESMVSTMAGTKIIQAATAVRKGRAKPEQLTKLSNGFIDPSAAKIIAREFEKHGFTEGSLMMPNTTKWDVTRPEIADALQKYRAAIAKEVETIIITPGQDKPLWLDGPVSGAFGQFRSFSYASMQRATLLSAQRLRSNPADVGTYLALGSQIALGALSTVIKLHLAGRFVEATDDWDYKDWLVEGVDRSGVTGYIFDANNILEKSSRGTLGISGLLGKEPMSRYAQRSTLDAIFGPSVGLVTDGVNVLGSAAGSTLSGDMEWTSRDTHTLRRLLPFQNLWYMRQHIFNPAEEAANEFFGFEDGRKSAPRE